MRIFGTITTSASHRYTPYCLRSFFRTTPLAPAERLFVIDNDGNYEPQPDEAGLPVELVRNEAPRSYAANGNFLIDLALREKGDLYFLNNDIILTEGWIEPLLATDDAVLSPLSNREVQYVSSVMVVKSQKVQDVFMTAVGMKLEDYLEHEKAFDYIAETHRKKTEGSWTVYMVPFFCVKLPYRILSEVGRFDESFGRAGGEDFDYCLRTYLKGFSVRFALKSCILHFGGKSSWSGAETRDEQHEREDFFRSRFAEKWGRKLCDLILFEKHEVLDSVPGAREADKRSELKWVIESLLER